MKGTFFCFKFLWILLSCCPVREIRILLKIAVYSSKGSKVNVKAFTSFKFFHWKRSLKSYSTIIINKLYSTNFVDVLQCSYTKRTTRRAHENETGNGTNVEGERIRKCALMAAIKQEPRRIRITSRPLSTGIFSALFVYCFPPPIALIHFPHEISNDIHVDFHPLLHPSTTSSIHFIYETRIVK